MPQRKVLVVVRYLESIKPKLMRVFLLMIAFLLFERASGQSRDQQRALTVQTLLSALYNGDTVRIRSLYADLKYFETRKPDLEDNIRLIKELVGKYGFPRKSTYKFLKGRDGENLIEVPLLTTPNKKLNLKKVTLYVGNYPDQLLSDPLKILDFGIVRQRLHYTDEKIMPPPPSD